MKKMMALVLIVVILMSALTVGAATAILYGDINADGTIDNRDLGLLQRYLNGWDVQLGPTGDTTTTTTTTTPADPDTPAQDLSTTEKILAAAFALRDGESLQTPVTLTGKVISIDSPYDASFGNVTLTFTVNGKNLKCYRLKGTGADKVKEGDTITVTGTIKNYLGTVEFDSGCTLDKLVPGTVTQKEYKVVDAPKTGVAYKFGMVQGNVSATNVYYLLGHMSGFYMATGTSSSTAVDVYLESADGGYYLYAMVNGKKQYINMVVSGTHVNGQYADKASTVYTYDEDAKTVVAMVQPDGATEPAAYWFGTRNDKTYTTVGPCKTEYEGFYCQFYEEE